MSILFDLLYREYCRARLAEMRKQLPSTGNHEVSEANGDADHADRAADRHVGSGGARYESGPGKLV
jgi:hypothetical protein